MWAFTAFGFGLAVEFVLLLWGYLIWLAIKAAKNALSRWR